MRGIEGDATVTALMGRTVRLAVTADGYELREPAQEEAAAHFAALRPMEPVVPTRDPSITANRALDEIGFADSSRRGLGSAGRTADAHDSRRSVSWSSCRRSPSRS